MLEVLVSHVMFLWGWCWWWWSWSGQGEGRWWWRDLMRSSSHYYFLEVESGDEDKMRRSAADAAAASVSYGRAGVFWWQPADCCTRLKTTWPADRLADHRPCRPLTTAGDKSLYPSATCYSCPAMPCLLQVRPSCSVGGPAEGCLF